MGFFGLNKNKVSANSIFVIEPYKSQYGSWVFDDERVGLIKEPFVAGADKMIDVITKDIKDADKGFILRFSTVNFPCSNIELHWVRSEAGGNWYKSDVLKMEGWLCPALFRYFKKVPKVIYGQAVGKNDV